MHTWYVLDADRARVEVVESYDTLDSALAELGTMSWDDDNPLLLS